MGPHIAGDERSTNLLENMHQETLDNRMLFTQHCNENGMRMSERDGEPPWKRASFTPLAVPFALSDVALAADSAYGIAQARNPLLLYRKFPSVNFHPR